MNSLEEWPSAEANAGTKYIQHNGICVGDRVKDMQTNEKGTVQEIVKKVGVVRFAVIYDQHGFESQRRERICPVCR